MNYTDQIEIRDIEIDGETNWYWRKSDTGAFGRADDGPMRDWLESHKEKYFKHNKEFNTIVTAGACCGMYTRFYSKIFKKVYAFEPDPISFHCMVMNNQSDNVYKFNSALGSEPRKAALDVSNQTNVGCNRITDSGIDVRLLTIDSLGLETCDVIQLDVEGYEKDVILGAMDTIVQFSPTLILESFRDDSFMESIGYKFYESSFADCIYIPN